ncbi:beta-1,3-N-acetylglucosaminyltransferase lunatic protein, putative [Actinidia rufa]|uniref:Beta-1,3-N-acetylglucosaminyltransferase lunatic protein, putative n=1 Tax=Actinidia rufa TaxID=165716 RepID=A0A7J0DDL5_9ERIC|nr:beta-1,3-N-acetylglucosaminyltransferase lunatic protein, putative [Actinidia rufa]
MEKGWGPPGGRERGGEGERRRVNLTPTKPLPASKTSASFYILLPHHSPPPSPSPSPNAPPTSASGTAPTPPTPSSSSTAPPPPSPNSYLRRHILLPAGSRSAIRITRIIKEIVLRNESDLRWFVFRDDATVFFTHNLVWTLAKYDHDRWFYVGSGSENYEQNAKNSFDMAFGGGGFAISDSLARALDSCLLRYPNLYGSDARVFAWI